MKTTFSFKLLFCLPLLMHATSAFEHPEGLVRGGKTKEKNRELVDFTGVAGCEEKLSQCQAKMEGFTVPFSQMAGFLDHFEDDDVGVNELKAVLDHAQDVDFSTVKDAVATAGGDNPALFETQLSASLVELGLGPFLESVEYILNAGITLLGLFYEINLKPITELVTLIRKVIVSIPAGNFLQVVVPETVKYLSSMFVFIMQMSFGLRVSAEESGAMATCTEQALSCEFELYMTNVVPIVTGEMLLAKSLKEANV